MAYEDITQEFDNLLVHRDPEAEGALMIRDGVLVVRREPTIAAAMRDGLCLPPELQGLANTLQIGGSLVVLAAALLWFLFS